MSDERKLCVVVHIPPKKFGNTEHFLGNLVRFKIKHPLLWYSHHWSALPNIIRLKYDPTVVAHGLPEPKARWVKNNIIFITGVRVALKRGFTHMLYVEEDCRFGCDEWDDILWTEFLTGARDPIFGGTPVVVNPCGGGHVYAARFERFVVETCDRRVFPITTAGTITFERQTQCALFPNGALAIYRLKELAEVLGPMLHSNPGALARSIRAWDYYIGDRLTRALGVEIYDRFSLLPSEYSGYRDFMTTEAERRDALQLGKIVAVHQIKSGWKGPEKPVPYNNKPSASTSTVTVREQPRVALYATVSGRDHEFFKWFIRSCAKFCTGFVEYIAAIPSSDFWYKPLTTHYNWRIAYMRERRVNKGQNINFRRAIADTATSADYILHMDADCIWTAPVHPMDFFVNDKPVLLCRSHQSAGDDPVAMRLQAASFALGLPVKHDFVLRLPIIHHRFVYATMRERIESVQNKPFKDFIYEQAEDSHVRFDAFQALGAWAYERYKGLYHVASDDMASIKAPPMLRAQCSLGLDVSMNFPDGTTATVIDKWRSVLTDNYANEPQIYGAPFPPKNSLTITEDSVSMDQRQELV